MSRKFLNSVVKILADYKAKNGASMNFDQLLEELAKRKAPEIAIVNGDGKPIYLGEKQATPAGMFKRALGAVERAAQPGKKHADPDWVKATALIRAKLGIPAGAGRGRVADTTPAPSGDLEALL